MGLAMVLHEIPTGGGPPDPDPVGEDTFSASQTEIYQMPTIPLMTLGGWYIDSTFGPVVTKVSDPRSMTMAPTLVNPYGIIYEYSSYPAVSKDGTWIVLFGVGSSGGGWYAVYRVSDGVRMSGFFRGGGGVDPEFMWSPTDDNVGYYLSSRRCYRMDLPSGTSTELWTALRMDGTPFTYLRTGQEGRPSNDMRWHCLMGYMSPRTTATTEWVVMDRLSGTVYSQRAAAQFTDAVKTTPLTGQFVGTGDSGSNHTVLYDRDLNFVRRLHYHAAHGDLAIGSDGEEYLIYLVTDAIMYAEAGVSNNAMIRVRISDGNRAVVPGRTAGTDHFPTSAMHFSGIVSRDHPDWILVSHYTSSATTEFIRPGDHEVWLQNFMTGDVKRICHTHNWPDSTVDKDYWAETQASSNWAGDEFYFKSNWGTVDPAKNISAYRVTGNFW